MAEEPEPEEPAGAVVVAMEIIKGMSGQDALSQEELYAIIQQAEITPEELHQGFASVLYGLVGLVEAPMGLMEDPMDLVPPVIRRLRRSGLVAEEILPTLSGALTAAALGHPSRWRRHLGVVDGPEATAWAYTAWVVADLIDFLAGKGTVAELTVFTRRHAATGNLCLLAALRSDGYPRISPVEPRIFEDQLWIVGMPDTTRFRDLGRDPCFCLHTATIDTQATDGDAKLWGMVGDVQDKPLHQRLATALFEETGFDSGDGSSTTSTRPT
jgi:hypothetical protein